MSEMKNILEGINSRIIEVEEWISDLIYIKIYINILYIYIYINQKNITIDTPSAECERVYFPVFSLTLGHIISLPI